MRQVEPPCTHTHAHLQSVPPSPLLAFFFFYPPPSSSFLLPGEERVKSREWCSTAMFECVRRPCLGQAGGEYLSAETEGGPCTSTTHTPLYERKGAWPERRRRKGAWPADSSSLPPPVLVYLVLSRWERALLTSPKRQMHGCKTQTCVEFCLTLSFFFWWWND